VGPAESRLAHCSLSRLIVPNPVLVPPFISRGPPRQTAWETSISERKKYGREMAGQIYPNNCDFHVIVGFFNMPQNCDRGQTTLLPHPKEGMLRSFSPKKIRRLRPGLNPQSWVPEGILCYVDRASWIIWIITNSMHYLSSIYWIITPLHISGVSTAHHQEVECMRGTCGKWYLLYF
jgi:hypothetical protein